MDDKERAIVSNFLIALDDMLRAQETFAFVFEFSDDTNRRERTLLNLVEKQEDYNEQRVLVDKIVMGE